LRNPSLALDMGALRGKRRGGNARHKRRRRRNRRKMG
jgi:hypothetical protein